jgi:hypothetical protein
MPRSAIRMLPLLALGLASSGCLEVAVITAATSSSRGSGSSSPPPSSTPPSSTYPTGAPVAVANAQLSGTMGDIVATDTATAQSDSDAVVQLDVHQNDTHGWTMTRIELAGQRFADLQDPLISGSRRASRHAARSRCRVKKSRMRALSRSGNSATM